MPSTPFVRPRITKFFEPCHWPSHEGGSFWFGTLERYRATEDKDLVDKVESRFSDLREGFVEDVFTVEGGHITDMQIGSNTYSNCYFGDNAEGDIAINTPINDYVFCASFGPYTRSQHLEMVNGAISQDGSHYRGNPKLTCFAEIDLLDFIAGLHYAAPKLSEWKTSYPASKATLDDIVKYGETRNVVGISSGFRHDPSRIDIKDYWRTIFVKPERFSPEREFRIALGANAPHILLGSPPGLLISDKRLKRSIIRMGKL